MIDIEHLNRKMLRIRLIEERIAHHYKDQAMRCPVHLSIGQEAAAVGVCEALKSNDKMVSTHRGHAHYLAKGGSLKGLIGELYGKMSGCSKGNGGSMHLVDMQAGFYGSTSIVAGTVPVGVGLSFADHLKGDESTTVICIGDAAVEEGVFHEAANFASLHKLNVIFLCENNLYSCYTRVEHRQPQRPMRYVARAHELHYFLTEPNDVRDINFKTLKAIQAHGPAFIEVPTYRFIEHCGPNIDDNLGYRTAEEVKYWQKFDPLAGMDGMLQVSVQQEIDEAFADAIAAPYPDESEKGKYVFKDS